MEDSQFWYERVDELAAQGLLAPDAVLNTLTQMIERDVLEGEPELLYLRKALHLHGTQENGARRLTQSAFLSFLESSGFLPPSTRCVGTLVYRSLLYLSQYPFYKSIPEALTHDELVRALAWLVPERSRRIYDEGYDTRSRSPADFRRLLFQSFAGNGKPAVFNAEDARKQAERRAFDFTGADRPDSRRFAAINYDYDGDEMFHDVLDVLYATQPKDIGWRAPPRDAFRPIARELVGDRRVHFCHLSIPQDEFRAVARLIMTTYFGKPRVAIEQLADLDHVVDCITRPVIQRPDMGITWDVFDQAAGNGMQMFMIGLQRFLGPLYRNPMDEDITIEPLQSGKIVTWPILAQLGSLGVFSPTFPYVHQCKYYNVMATSVPASTLADDLDALSNAATVILLSGKNSHTGKRLVFGYYLPYAKYQEQDPPFLFQLSDFQDAFRGNALRPGRGLNRGELVCGKRGNGAMLALQKDSKKAIFSHSVSGQHGPMYAATPWRGDWQVEVEVEDIEL